jgi:hypothetical protein
MPPTGEIWHLAEMLYKGGMTPKNVSRPEQLAVRIVAGFELGLPPIQAINNIMVVNGRASIWGDAALGLVRASDLLAFHDEFTEGGPDDPTAGVCVVHRDGDAERREFRFSVDDAKTAGLWGKDGPWTNYPSRMLTMRARAWALRDVFPDVLCGLSIAEEQLDVPTEAAKSEALPAEPPQTEAQPATQSDSPPTTDQPITHDILVQLGQARYAWLRSQCIDVEDGDSVKEAWAKELANYGVSTAKNLTLSQGSELLAKLRTAGHRQETQELFGETAAAT